MTQFVKDVSEQLALWLGKPAPRYTSFPPAPFFHPGVTEKDYVSCLKSVESSESISLYIHIPFCKNLCLYCACNTIITRRPERITRYLESLKREISWLAQQIGAAHISQLHFGGGTPNILTHDEFIDLFNHLHQCFDFTATKEISIELDPRQVTVEQVNTLVTCGVTRVSLGIQDFNNKVQKTINRIQPYAMVANVCQMLRKAGVKYINFDLVYGLPEQTLESTALTAQQVISLRPDRVALFSYAHVPHIKKHQKVLENNYLPGNNQKLAMELIMRSALIVDGFIAIGMDHFARTEDTLTQAWRKGQLHRNFQGYTDDNSSILIGLGASSISEFKQGYFQNERDEKTYQDMVDTGQPATVRGFLLSAEDKVRKAIIERLMCRFCCDIEAICKEHQYDVRLLETDLQALSPYEEAGLVTRDGYYVSIVTPYRMAARVICSVFDHYSQSSMASTQAA